MRRSFQGSCNTPSSPGFDSGNLDEPVVAKARLSNVPRFSFLHEPVPKRTNTRLVLATPDPRDGQHPSPDRDVSILHIDHPVLPEIEFSGSVLPWYHTAYPTGLNMELSRPHMYGTQPRNQTQVELLRRGDKIMRKNMPHYFLTRYQDYDSNQWIIETLEMDTQRLMQRSARFEQSVTFAEEEYSGLEVVEFKVLDPNGSLELTYRVPGSQKRALARIDAGPEMALSRLREVLEGLRGPVNDIGQIGSSSSRKKDQVVMKDQAEKKNKVKKKEVAQRKEPSRNKEQSRKKDPVQNKESKNEQSQTEEPVRRKEPIYGGMKRTKHDRELLLTLWGMTTANAPGSFMILGWEIPETCLLYFIEVRDDHKRSSSVFSQYRYFCRRGWSAWSATEADLKVMSREFTPASKCHYCFPRRGRHRESSRTRLLL